MNQNIERGTGPSLSASPLGLTSQTQSSPDSLASRPGDPSSHTCIPSGCSESKSAIVSHCSAVSAARSFLVNRCSLEESKPIPAEYANFLDRCKRERVVLPSAGLRKYRAGCRFYGLPVAAAS